MQVYIQSRKGLAIAAVLTAVFCQCCSGASPRASKGLPPRATPGDYQAHAQAGKFTIAAEYRGTLHSGPAIGPYDGRLCGGRSGLVRSGGRKTRTVLYGFLASHQREEDAVAREGVRVGVQVPQRSGLRAARVGGDKAGPSQRRPSTREAVAAGAGISPTLLCLRSSTFQSRSRDRGNSAFKRPRCRKGNARFPPRD